MAMMNSAIILNIFEVVYSFEKKPENDNEAKEVGTSE